MVKVLLKTDSGYLRAGVSMHEVAKNFGGVEGKKEGGRDRWGEEAPMECGSESETVVDIELILC